MFLNMSNVLFLSSNQVKHLKLLCCPLCAIRIKLLCLTKTSKKSMAEIQPNAQLSFFTLSCQTFLSMLKVLAWRSQQNIIRGKRKTDPEVCKMDTHLSTAMPENPVLSLNTTDRMSEKGQPWWSPMWTGNKLHLRKTKTHFMLWTWKDQKDFCCF